MTSNDLLKKLHDHPFKPFRVRMVNSTTYDVVAPWMILVSGTSAIIATETGKTNRGYDFAVDWKTVSIRHMMEFSDLPTPAKGSKRGS